MDCVADTVYYESRGEGIEGMRAVAHVIYNRSEKEGKHPCIIVRQPKQFATGPSRPRDKLWQLAKRVVMNPGPDLTRGATYFHNRSVSPYWIRRMVVTFQFGGHIFYKPR